MSLDAMLEELDARWVNGNLQKIKALIARNKELEEIKLKYDALLEHNTRRDFHGYTILANGTILNKKGEPLKFELRERNGGAFDHCVRMYINGRAYKFTVQRLIAAAFQGPIFGYEINHDNRDTLHNDNSNLSRMTPSQNQLHWRGTERKMI